LEWFNPPMGGEAWIGVPCCVDIGTEQDWMSRARDEFHQLEIEIPSV
jgi:hypothetical protein